MVADAFHRGDVLVVDACEVVQKMMRENCRSYNPLISARRRLCLAGLSLAVGMAVTMGPAAPLAFADDISGEDIAPIAPAVVTAGAEADGPSSNDVPAEPAESFELCDDVPGSSDGGAGAGLPVSGEAPDGSVSDLEGSGTPAGEASDLPSTPSSGPSDEPGVLDPSPATEREGDCSDAPDVSTDSATSPADDLPTDALGSCDEADTPVSPTDVPAASGEDQASDLAQAPEPVDSSNGSSMAAEPLAQSIQQGWLTKDGNRYYLGKDGKPLVGEQKVDGGVVLLRP